MRNVFPPRLREIVELDEYLQRVQASTKARSTRWQRREMGSASEIILSLRARIVEVRRAIRREIDALVVDIPIVQSALGVKVLDLMAFLRLAIRVDIERATNPAKLWRYCGLGVSDTLADTRSSAAKPGTIRFSSACYRAMTSIRWGLTRNAAYREARRQYHDEQLANGVNPLLARKRSGRFVMKLFLKHLWLVWRRQEGLPVGDGHPNDISRLAAPFGWA